jgi:hypothetical protein
MADVEVDVTLLNYYKDLYSGHKIIYVRFLDTDFIFRTLTRKEYKYILQSSTSEYEVEDKICNTTCVYPEDYDFETCGFAGLNEYVADVIQQLSGFKDIQFVLNEYRQIKANVNLEIQCMDLIKAFIPEYTYEEMEEWTWEKLMFMTARAEKIAELKGFDWHIQDQTEEYMNEMSKINSDNKEFVNELQNNGIDPMFYFSEELKSTFTHDIIEFPMISGANWNDEVILDAIRKQARKKNPI